jgi:hypothetical protein
MMGVQMFVVRLKRPGEDVDLKALRSRKAAVARFRTAQRELIDGEVEACALLEIDAPDATSALELAIQGQGRVIEANLQESLQENLQDNLQQKLQDPMAQASTSEADGPHDGATRSSRS